MKRNEAYILSNVAGSSLLVSTSGTASYSNNVVSLNQLGAELWDIMKDDVTKDVLVEYVVDKYDNSNREEISSDIDAFLMQLEKEGCLE